MPTVPDMVAATPAALKLRSVPRYILHPVTGEVMQVVIDHPQAEYVYVVEHDDGTVSYIGADDAIANQDALFGGAGDAQNGTPNPDVAHLMKVDPWTGEVRCGAQSGKGRRNVRQSFMQRAQELGVLN